MKVFELIFIHGNGQASSLILLCLDNQFSTHHLLKRLLHVFGILVKN